jgi:hypothetical protein
VICCASRTFRRCGTGQAVAARDYPARAIVATSRRPAQANALDPQRRHAVCSRSPADGRKEPAGAPGRRWPTSRRAPRRSDEGTRASPSTAR